MTGSILDAANGSVLQRLAAVPSLVAFDFDGTLAPIVRRPSDAALSPVTLALLERVAWAYPTAVVSGRSVGDLRPRLGGVALAAVVGNHGRECGRCQAPGGPALDQWHAALVNALAGCPGVEVEHKGLSLSIHWREAPRWARRRIGGAVAALSPGPRVMGGRRVTNLLPADSVDKGSAVRAVARAAGVRLALYVGDDETDEDVFRVHTDLEVIGIRVGCRAATAAEYRVRSQREVDRLLRRLVSLQTGLGVSPLRVPRRRPIATTRTASTTTITVRGSTGPEKYG